MRKNRSANVNCARPALGVFIALVSAVLIASPVCGAESGWRLSLRPSSTTVLPAEPVLGVATTTYQGSKPFVGFVGFGQAGLTYTNALGEELGGGLSALRFEGPSDGFPPSRAITYEPGYECSLPVIALYDSSRDMYLFQSAGDGSLEMYALIWQGARIEDYRGVMLRSDPVTITVVPPSADQAKALALWTGRRQAEAFVQGEAAAEAELKALVTTYPASVYSRYALMALARVKERERHRLAVNGILPPEREAESQGLASEEVALLEQAVDRDRQFHLLPVVLDRLVQASDWLPPADRHGKLRKYADILLQQPHIPHAYRQHAEQALRKLQLEQAVGAGKPK